VKAEKGTILLLLGLGLLGLGALLGAFPRPQKGPGGLEVLRREEGRVVRLEVRHTREVPLFAEVFRPAQGEDFPSVVLVHGGFWGPSESLRELARSWAGRGFLVALPHLRGQGRSGGRFTFCREEGEDLRALAEGLTALGGRRARAYVGFSLGGCIALLAAREDPWARGVVAALTPLDFSEQYALLERAGREEALERWRRLIGGSPASCPSCYALRSPLTWAKEVAAPVHLLQAGKDPLISPRQACRFAQAREEAGHRVHQVALQEDGSPWREPLQGGSACLRPTGFGPPKEDHLVLFPSLTHRTTPALLARAEAALQAWLR
jgi:dienelactone hydrolase